jgi:DNA-binding CsgD family transcriptional regulator
MDHFILLIMLFALILGTWAAVYTFQFDKIYGKSFLRFLVRYVFFLNLAVFLYLVTKYLYLNFPVSLFTDPKSGFYTIVFLIATIVEIGLIYSYVSVVLGLKGVEGSNTLNRFFAAGLILVGISTIIGITTYMNIGSNTWIMVIYMGVVIIAAIVILSANISLILQRSTSNNTKNNNKAVKSVRAFGGLNLVGYVVFFGSAALSESVGLYVSASVLLFLNMVPIVWLNKFFLQNYINLSPDENLQFLDVALKNYQISNREREIMELILQGKSNKEIEDVLFISYNTVKNHIYNLYQKLGVKSRGQLINFILESRKKIER